MARVDVFNTSGEKISQVDLTDAIFNVPVKTSILHEAVNTQLARRRSGTASVKHRSDVRGSGRKLFRQKGTGRARRGNAKAPLLRGGGVVFGPDNRSYAKKMPKKAKKLALKMALSSKLQEQKLLVLDNFDLDQIKTKAFTKIIDTLKMDNALIVIDQGNANLELSSRNVPAVKVLRCEGLNVYDILKYSNLVLIESSIKGIEGRLLT
jgi:large subunit ribosomal protein L4